MMAPQPLTTKQRAIYDFLVRQIRAYDGVAPSLHEICSAFNLRSSASAHKHLSILAEKGYITRRKGFSRAITLVSQDGHCYACGQRLPVA